MGVLASEERLKHHKGAQHAAFGPWGAEGSGAMSQQKKLAAGTRESKEARIYLSFPSLRSTAQGDELLMALR